MASSQEILRLFPGQLREKWKPCADCGEWLEEIRLRAKAPVLYYVKGKEFVLEKDKVLSPGELEEIVKYLCRYSIYAYEEEMSQGFLSLEGGHRVGFAGSVILKENKVRHLKHISSMNIRLASALPGVANGVLPFLYEKGSFVNTLLISPPGCGKTTLLRDLVRYISEGNAFGTGQTVGVVDERMEIAGCFQGIPQNDLGIRTDVLSGCKKSAGLMMLLRSMSPKVVAADELGGEEDVLALRQVNGCGCGILATIHGSGREEAMARPFIKELFGENIFGRQILLGRKNGSFYAEKIWDNTGKVLAEHILLEVPGI